MRQGMGGKPKNGEYWSGRTGHRSFDLLPKSRFAKKLTHRIERQHNKPNPDEVHEAVTSERDPCQNGTCKECGA